MPLLHVSGVYCSSGGSPPPPPPSLAACVMRELPFRGDPLLCPLLGPRALCVRWGSPSGSGGPPRWAFPRWFSQGPPPLPSLHDVGTHSWVGVPPLPSPPLHPLALSARGRSGGGLHTIALSAVRPAALSLLGVSSPPDVCWAVPFPPRRPLALGSRGRSGGGLSTIAFSAVLQVAPALLEVSSPPAVFWAVLALCFH